MAIPYGDHVLETTAVVGTGPATLLGAQLGAVAFSTVCADGDTPDYEINNLLTGEWETGNGTYAAAGNTLTRTTVFKSSNGNAAVNFAAGTKNVFIPALATRLASLLTVIASDARKAPLASPALTGSPTTGGLNIGYKEVPHNSQSANYTTALADSGKHILHPASDANARTFTIDSNANVAYPIGTAITFVNQTAQVLSIAITADTMTLANSTTTGTRSLAQNGMATALKVSTTGWIIGGSGLT